MTISVCSQRIFIGVALMLFWFVSTAHAGWQASMADATVIAEVARPMESE